MLYIPSQVETSFLSIDYHGLKQVGYKVILFDLDNTLAPYTDSSPTEELKQSIKAIQDEGFKIYLVSNNNNQRIQIFTNELGLAGALAKAGKPGANKILQFLREKNIKPSEVIAVGDQLVTDILAYNRAGLYSVLVKTIDKKTQKWYTKINRLREKKIIKKICLENPEIGRKILEL